VFDTEEAVATLRTVTERASEFAEEVKEFGRTAADKLEGMREGTGSALHGAATSVRKGSAAVDEMASGAAGKLDAAGSFVQECSAKNIAGSITKFGREHLTGTLMVVAAVSFLAGSAMSRPVRSRNQA
jgi:hypothetical protein